ncbi:Heavy metal-associated isoprenylated plant protein 7 [Heracleum sosnowskyi]|uniref:Heavy metal-associated isoprenylated plant protein 7 n=1 Tax=Heracleum sosnowskyi TaxID=360622 RepID=A0AAD8HQG1_9APIA|nr:Heavy metal-associated isoprenylated plant protein 7 [Heracleum sosnowskyi]
MTEKNIEGNKLNPKDDIVLGVFIHCEGCAKTIHKSLRGFEGVEVIEIDSKNHKVTVKGEKADPIKVVERVRKKSRKHVELISPGLLSKDTQEEIKEVKKEEPKLVEITLKVNLHCPGCATDVKQTIHKLKGVLTVETYLKDSIVKVMGSMEAEKIVELVKKMEGKQAVIVKQEKKGGEKKGGGGKKDDRNKNQTEGGEHQKGGRKEKDPSSVYQNYPSHIVYAPQLFSDENPNACSIM